MPSSVAPPPAPVRRTIRLQMVAAAIVALLVVVIALSHRPSPSLAAAPADTQPERLVPSSDIEPVPQPLETTPAAAPDAAANVVAPRAGESSKKAPALKPQKNRIADSAGPREAVTAIAEALGAENSTSTPVASESISAEPAPLSPAAVGAGAVTINGCLETSKDRFRLTDTDGVDAPRSRSWRTGFLKKHSNSVALVDPPDPHGLQAQVGQRVAATGVLTDRELRVTSVRPIGDRCN